MTRRIHLVVSVQILYNAKAEAEGRSDTYQIVVGVNTQL